MENPPVFGSIFTQIKIGCKVPEPGADLLQTECGSDFN